MLFALVVGLSLAFVVGLSPAFLVGLYLAFVVGLSVGCVGGFITCFVDYTVDQGAFVGDIVGSGAFVGCRDGESAFVGLTLVVFNINISSFYNLIYKHNCDGIGVCKGVFVARVGAIDGNSVDNDSDNEVGAC